MNGTMTTRDSLLNAIDEINDVVLESEGNVLYSIMDSASKIVTIMEHSDFTFDDFDKFSTFYQEDGDTAAASTGSNDEGLKLRKDKEDGTKENILYSIIAAPFRIIAFIAKKIASLFTAEKAEETQQAASKFEGLTNDAKNIAGEFLRTGQVPTSVVIGGATISGAALGVIFGLLKDNIVKGFNAIKGFFQNIAKKIQSIKDKFGDIDQEFVKEVADIAKLGDEGVEAFGKYFYCKDDKWFSVLNPKGVEAFYNQATQTLENIGKNLNGVHTDDTTYNKIKKDLAAVITKTHPITHEPGEYSNSDIAAMFTYIQKSESPKKLTEMAEKFTKPQEKVAATPKEEVKLLKDTSELMKTFCELYINITYILSEMNNVYLNTVKLSAKGDEEAAKVKNNASAEPADETGKKSEGAAAGGEGADESSGDVDSTDDAEKEDTVTPESFVDDFDMLDTPYTAYVEFYDEAGEVVEEAFIDEDNDVFYVLEGGTYNGGNTIGHLYTPKAKFVVDVEDPSISIEDDDTLEKKLDSLDSPTAHTRTVKIKPTAKGLTVDYVVTKVSKDKKFRSDSGHRLVITGEAAVKKSNIMRNKKNVENTSKKPKTIRQGNLDENQKKKFKEDRDKAIQEGYVETTTSSWYSK